MGGAWFGPLVTAVRAYGSITKAEIRAMDHGLGLIMLAKCRAPTHKPLHGYYDRQSIALGRAAHHARSDLR